MKPENENTNANTQTMLPTIAKAEAKAIHDAAVEDAGFAKMLKFKKGDFFIDDVEVPLGTEFLVHASSWVKGWIKFVDDKVAERRHYRVALGEKPVSRNDLDDLDLAETDDDPWSLQFMLPFENMNNGEVFIFTTASYGGKRAVADLCEAYAKRRLRGNNGQPVVKLATVIMPTKNFGPVPRPHFEIDRWDDTAPLGETKAVEVAEAAEDDMMNDEIPF